MLFSELNRFFFCLKQRSMSLCYTDHENNCVRHTDCINSQNIYSGSFLAKWPQVKSVTFVISQIWNNACMEEFFSRPFKAHHPYTHIHCYNNKRYTGNTNWKLFQIRTVHTDVHHVHIAEYQHFPCCRQTFSQIIVFFTILRLFEHVESAVESHRLMV